MAFGPDWLHFCACASISQDCQRISDGPRRSSTVILATYYNAISAVDIDREKVSLFYTHVQVLCVVLVQM